MAEFLNSIFSSVEISTSVTYHGRDTARDSERIRARGCSKLRSIQKPQTRIEGHIFKLKK